MIGKSGAALAVLMVLLLLVSGCGEKTLPGDLPGAGQGPPPAPDPEDSTTETEYVIYLNTTTEQTGGT